MNKLLIVGQKPPPYHGQAIMIQELVKICSNFPEIKYVRMGFSTTTQSIGKFEFIKILELIKVIGKVWLYRFFHSCDVLYFPPTGGSNKIPLYRDFFILVFTRFLFKKTIFHFHAWGLHEIYPKLNILERYIFNISYKNPDLSIIMSSKGQNDPLLLNSRNIRIIPNGIVNALTLYNKEPVNRLIKHDFLTILYVGILKESKGVNILLESSILLKSKGYDFKVNFVGSFESEQYELVVKEFVMKNGLEHIVSFLGVKVGVEKDRLFKESDIFCFPTFYECENFPNVIIEAMSYSLPVVTTDWRGISSIVLNEESGILCPIKEPNKIADSLEQLINDYKLRIAMGVNGKKKYDDKYTLEKFGFNMIDVFKSI